MAYGDLTTLANVKAWLGMSQDADNMVIARLITSASLMLGQYANRNFMSASYTINVDGTGGAVLMLRQYPVTAVASVSINGLALPVSTGPGVAGYRFTQSRVIVDGYRFTKGNANIVVAYTGGFTTVPPDLEQAAIELIALRYKERDRIGHTSKTLAGETVGFFIGDMPASVKTLMAQYRTVATM